ncbi:MULTISPECIES: DivIVA domain-containing protein [Streptomyces]|uniref:DivIVA domain-containing protein n=1 Tax=Streptomyces TaxID=1883 RepID=UPI00099764B6|nr:DivIVA domain-containing protein [Streptomyces sp. JV180]
MRVFWFLLLTMVVVVTAVTLAVVGGGGSAVLQDVPPERLTDPLPAARPVGRADIDALRLPMALRGYRMADVDDALARLGAELAERDARIAELESTLAGDRAAAVTAGTELFEPPGDRPAAPGERPLGPGYGPVDPGERLGGPEHRLAEPGDRTDGRDRTEEDGR